MAEKGFRVSDLTGVISTAALVVIAAVEALNYRDLYRQRADDACDCPCHEFAQGGLEPDEDDD